MDAIKKVSITIDGGGISFKREIDERIAAQIIGLCLSAEEAFASSASKKMSNNLPYAHPKFRKESTAEYINRFAANRNPDKILTLAAYLRDIQGRDSFNSGEIKSLFRDAGEILPANFSRDFLCVRNLGWIANDPHAKGNFYITNTGLNVLKDGFPKEIVLQSKFRTIGRRRKIKSKGKKKV
jgi:hypothetical protein